MILLKLGDEYKLYSHDSCIATTQESPHKRLSKQNCDSLFGVVDIDKLVQDYMEQFKNPMLKNYRIGEAFNDGFNKAMELNKDKLFTVEDVKKIVEMSRNIKYVTFSIDELILSLQQPTEIEVDIKMDYAIYLANLPKEGEERPVMRPVLDENGCLILKKK